jgi:ankyrin repeat protein
LETLRPCLPPSVRTILNELPETLDETYERILQEIPKSNRLHARRLLQCLTVAVRPLRVEELAEVLAIDFDSMGGIPKLNEDLRWEDQEQAVLSACSSLIAVVEDDSSRVVQFSHFSVKEFLTSHRLATSTIEASHYHHILLEPSHTIMAQACLSVLLGLDPHNNNSGLKGFPLNRYASEHFGYHAEFGNVFVHIRDGIDDLLDADKHHFAAWFWGRQGDFGGVQGRPEASPLYHVAGFGFRAMVDHLISKRPDDLTVRGRYGIPLHASLRHGHANVALLLLGHCVDVDVRGINGRTPLHMAVDHGLLEVTRILIERGASINAQDSRNRTPLHPIFDDKSRTFDDIYFDVVRYLLEHGIDVDAQADTEHSTPLHLASYYGGFKIARLLLDHQADINMRDKNGRTPLHGTLVNMNDSLDDYFFDAVRFLLEHGADVHALDNDHATPLHVVSESGGIKAARLLLQHGAVVDAQDNRDSTPLHVASQSGNAKVARLLLEGGANIHVRNKANQTPQHLLLAMWSKNVLDDDIDAVRIVLESGVDVDSVNDTHRALLHGASYFGSLKVAQLLLDHGANINVRDGESQTPLHRVLDRHDVESDPNRDHFFDVTSFLVKRGADIYALDNNRLTPLHFATRRGNLKAARVLLEHGAIVDVQDNKGSTPLHVASQYGNVEFSCLLLEHGADVHALDNNHSTPLHCMLQYGSTGATRVMLEHGAVVDARDNKDSTPLHVASQCGNVETACLLLEHGAGVNTLDNNHSTPLHYASQYGKAEIARALLERGAVVDAQDNEDSTPLHVALQCGNAEVARLMLEHGANIHVRNKEDQTPHHLLLATWNKQWPYGHGDIDIIQLFLERGADVDAVDDDHSTLLHAASYHGSVEAAQLLLKRGANTNVRDAEGQTPLHRTLVEITDGLEDHYFDVIQLLLEHGADVDASDDDHSTSTPLHQASQYGSVKATRLLLEHGANVHLQNTNGHTPSQVASMNGHDEIARLLLDHSQSEKNVTFTSTIRP